MWIHSVYEDAFRPYGEVVEGYDLSELLCAMGQTPCPEEVAYVASDPRLEALPSASLFSGSLYGGMPVQLGWCNGYNTRLNCLEYHRDSEFDLAASDLILLLARLDQMEAGKLDTARVEAFFCPKGTLMNLYATTLHFAPCSARYDAGFRMLVALPRGTNRPRPALEGRGPEDERLWGCNKWMLDHPQSEEAAQGAYVGLVGPNIDIAPLLQSRFSS